MYILGISAYYHDSAACLLRDGVLVAAAQEERFTRRKHDAAFPTQAIAYRLHEAGITARELGLVAFYEKPFLKFERILETFLSVAPRGLAPFLQAVPLWIKKRLWMKDEIRRVLDYDGPLICPEHHRAHAGAAFFPSPFREAAILTMDGVGEWSTTSYGVGRDAAIELQAELRFPHSLGLLYSAFTYYLGFRVNSGEYKVMGLAPYGEPRYTAAILDHLVELHDDGSLALNMDYFNYCVGMTMTNTRFAQLFGGPPRTPESPLEQRHMDLARSIQEVTEEAMLRMARHVQRTTGQHALCLGGGVALNCVGNGRILREGPFTDLWVQPAAGDAGGAVGAAFCGWHEYLGHAREAAPDDAMHGAFLGPAFAQAEIDAFLTREGVACVPLDDDTLAERVAALLAEGRVIGWFQGRMEFGPRALGNRSILGDPRSPRMQSLLNQKIKGRESFRPFAPAVLAEHAGAYFELDRPSPYMLLTAPVHPSQRVPLPPEAATCSGLARLAQPRSTIPAVTHVDDSARVQTVHAATNPRFHRLLTAFAARTGCPVLINTSFNVRGEPMVCTPEEAYACYRHTAMDGLVLGNSLLLKEAPGTLDTAWMTRFAPD